MSKINEVLNNGQQATFNYDVSKTFVWNPRFLSGDLTNSEYDPITIPEGTVMGRVAATGKLVPWKSTAVDGSQFPRGILAEEVIVDDGETQTIAIVISGDVAEEKVKFALAGDGFNTVVSGKILRDRLGSDTNGIYLVTATELSGYDNH